MAGYYNHNAGTTYKCIDSDPKSLQGGHTDNNGYLFLCVEGRCGSLKCPPYAEGRDMLFVSYKKKITVKMKCFH